MARVLLVEDEIGAIAAVKRSLTRAGFDVLVATNLPDAISAAENEQPDALLVASGLQGENVASVVDALRAVDPVRPLIVMGEGTGTGEPTLARPVDSQALIALLHELLSTAPSGEPTGSAVPTEVVPEFAPPPGPWAPSWSPEAPAGHEYRAPELGAEFVPFAPTPAALAQPDSDLAHRRELAVKALVETQTRRKVAERARLEAEAAQVAAAVGGGQAVRPVSVPAPAATLPVQSSPVRRSPTRSPVPPVKSPRAIADEVTDGSDVAELADAPFDARGEPVRNPRFLPSLPPPSLGAQLFDDLAPELPLDPHDLPAAKPLDSGSASNIQVRRAAAPTPIRHVPTMAFEPLEPETVPRPPFPPEGLGLPLEGSLDRLEPAALLVACHRARLSGQLRLDQGRVQRILYMADGRLSGASSTSPEERLEALTYRRGLITREQQRLLRAEAATLPTRRLALLMVERSYLKPAELFPLVQERVEEVVHEACGGFVGSYRIGPETVSDDERVALSRSPLTLATESIRRKYLMERLLVGLGGPATLLKPAEATGPELSEYGFTARERRLAQAVDGLRNIEEILFESGMEPLPGLKVLYALLLGRTIEVAVRGLATEATPDVEARIDLARVGEKYEQVRSANYFEVLGVSPGATAYEIQQAYERLAREFLPVRFRELRRPELPGQLDEIQRVLAEARDILVDTGLRDEYRAHLRK